MLESGAHALGCPVFPAGIGQTELQVQAVSQLRPSGYVGTPSFLNIVLVKADPTYQATFWHNSGTGDDMAPGPFARILESASPAGAKAGIGTLARRMAGCATVDAAPGKGLVVQIYLPRYDASGDGSTTEPESRGQGQKILLVEDNDAIRKLVVAVGRAPD